VSHKSYSVLAADDEYWARENLRSLIDWGKHGFVFLEPASDGADALRRIESEKPDIVISDVNMPYVSGTELIEKCVEKFPGTVFIALSGYDDYHFVRSTLVGGAIDYLLKPISEAELVTVLGKAVDRLANRGADAQNRSDALELKRQASMLALDQEYSTYLKSISESDSPVDLTGRLADYELEYSGYALALFNAPGLSGGANAAAPFGDGQAVCAIKDIIEREAIGSKRLVFHNTHKAGEFILITDMRIHQLKEACRALLLKLFHATDLTFSAVISRYYYSFASLSKAYNEAALALLCGPSANKSMVILAADRDASINLARATIDSVVDQVCKYIDENYFEDDLSLSILSDRFHVESSYLSRAFKKSTGVNLTFYITQKRVAHAKEYLADGLLSIKEISQLVGYGDYAYFSRIFRKMTGVSPKYYSDGKGANVSEVT